MSSCCSSLCPRSPPRGTKRRRLVQRFRDWMSPAFACLWPSTRGHSRVTQANPGQAHLGQPSLRLIWAAPRPVPSLMCVCGDSERRGCGGAGPQQHQVRRYCSGTKSGPLIPDAMAGRRAECLLRPISSTHMFLPRPRAGVGFTPTEEVCADAPTVHLIWGYNCSWACRL